MGLLEEFVSRVIFGKLICVSPTVRKESGKLVIASGWRSQLFTLGMAGRRVVVDPAQKVVRIVSRRFWFVRSSRRIEFDWVAEVLYGYNDLSIGWYAYQEMDLFTIHLHLKNGERVLLSRFFGAGDFVNNSVWPDWMYWEDTLVAKYSRGGQESESELVADLLGRMIGVPIENPTP